MAIAKTKPPCLCWQRELQATWRFQRLLHRLGTSSALGMLLAAKRRPSDALGAGRFKGSAKSRIAPEHRSLTSTPCRVHLREEPKNFLAGRKGLQAECDSIVDNGRGRERLSAHRIHLSLKLEVLFKVFAQFLAFF